MLEILHLLYFEKFFDKVYRFREIFVKVAAIIIIIIIIILLTSRKNGRMDFDEPYIKRRVLVSSCSETPHMIWNSDVLGVKIPKNPVFSGFLGGIFPQPTGHNS